MDPIEQLEPSIRECVKLCEAAHDHCQYTLLDCLAKGGRHATPQHIRLLMDCAQIAQLNVDFLLRSSTLFPSTCQACAEICEACARDCEQHFESDSNMMACAALCRQSAFSCREISGAELFSRP